MLTRYHHYRLHGVCLRSELSLPAREVTSSVGWDVTIYRGSPCRPAATPQGTPWQTVVDGEMVTLQAAPLGRFHIGPAEITVHPLPNLDLELLGQALVGAPLAVWLHQRGRHLIHGSALSVDGQAIGIVGPSGAGKSTLSATLWRRGHALVTDDLMALEMGPQSPRVFPGSPYLKLWPASLTAMDENPESLPRLYRDVDKRRLDATEAMASDPLPLVAMYTLCWGDARSIQRLGPNEAFAALLANTFVSGVLASPADQTHQRHFDQATQIAERVPVRRICWVRSLEELPALAQGVEADVRSL